MYFKNIRMKSLSIYVLKEFIHPLFYSLFSFVLIFVVVEVLQRIKTFYDNHVSIYDILSFYLYKIPFIVVQLFPIAAILAILFSLGNLVKNNEIIALRSSGINIFRIFLPLFIFTFLLGIALFYFNEYVVIGTSQKAEKINNERIRKLIMVTDDIETNTAYHGDKGELLFVEKYNKSNKILEGIKLFIFNKKNELEKMIISDKAYWDKNQWMMDKGYVRIFDSNNIIGEHNEEKKFLPFSSSPDDLSIGQRTPEQFSFWELKKYLARIKQSAPQDYQRYLVDFYTKISIPFSSFIIVIFGIPIALRHQSGSKTIEFGMGILVSFIFWGSNHIFYSLGKNNIISPFISAWIGDIIFFIIGVYLIYRNR